MKRFFLVITGIAILITGFVACTSPATVAPKPVPTPAPTPTSKPAPTPSSRSPQLKSVEPNIGPADGGTEVLISGTNLGATATVTFGGVDAVEVKVVSDNLVQTRTPPHQPGTVEVVVTDRDRIKSTLPYGFTYIQKRVAATPKPTPTPTRTATPSSTPTPVPVPTPPPGKFALQIEIVPSGYGSVAVSPPGGTYDRDTPVTLTATPASPKYGFISWGGSLLASINPITILMDANKSISAHFVYIGP